MAKDRHSQELLAEIERNNLEYDKSAADHDRLHAELEAIVSRCTDLDGDHKQLLRRYDSLSRELQHSKNRSTYAEINNVADEANAIAIEINRLRDEHRQTLPLHDTAMQQLFEIVTRNKALIDQLKDRSAILDAIDSDKERVVQHRDETTKVSVGRRYDFRTGQFTSDIHIFSTDPNEKTHRHIGFSETTGDIIFDVDRPDKDKE